jgi:hypothetical protein
MNVHGIVVAAAILLSCQQAIRAEDEVLVVKSDFAAVQAEIQAARTEDAKYSGGLVKALIASRIATLCQTEAMLQQRLLSFKVGVQLKYTVDGKAFSLPASAEQTLADVETEITASEMKIHQQEAEVARFSGGLAQAMAVATLETMRQTHAMLEQKRISLKYGLPQYIGFVDVNGKQKAAPAQEPIPATLSRSSQVHAGDGLRKVIALSVVEKGFISSDPSANRYQDLITIKCSYSNGSEKDVRAFTGAVVFQDLFGKEIFRANITISDPLVVGQQSTWVGTIKYNQFMDAHQRIRNTELRDLTVVWVPASILFTDGSKAGEGSDSDYVATGNGNKTSIQENPGTRRTEGIPAPAAYVRNTQSSKSVVVRFTSNPPDAELWVDGEYWGATPTADLTHLSAGPHTILVKKPGYQPWERKITLALGDDRTISAELESQPNDPTRPRIVGNN